MRLWKLWVGSVALGATAAVSVAMGMQSSGTMPDPAKAYYQRQNCHGAYDLLNADVEAGSTPSDGDRAWARAHEDAAIAKKPCPAPPPALAKRATDRTVSTGPGMKMVGNYMRQNDRVALFEGGYRVLTSPVKLDGVTPQDGVAMLRRAADLGDAHAKFVIASLFISGQATGKADYAAGFPFAEGAATAGHPDALNMLGSMHLTGLGTKKNERLGFDYLSKAAANGHVMATFLAAKMALDGAGVKKDPVLAYRLARNLADQGEVSGAVLAAGALLQQKRNEDNEKEVLYWMDVALRDGDAKVKAEIGKLRPQVIAAYQRVNAPPEYRPRVRKLCPMKTVCYVSSYSGARQSCTTNKDYWNDCNL